MTTTREIFALRKTNLAEAYRLAKQLYESNPADDWACKAIGWVLYDQLKAALVAKDVAAIQQYSHELAQKFFGLRTGASGLPAGLQNIIPEYEPAY